MEGKGIYEYSDGRIYEGYFEDNKRNGIGKFIWPDGREFCGPWKNGKQDGIGKLKGKDGIERTGQWSDGKFIGWILTEKNKKGNSQRSPKE